MRNKQRFAKKRSDKKAQSASKRKTLSMQQGIKNTKQHRRSDAHSGFKTAFERNRQNTDKLRRHTREAFNRLKTHIADNSSTNDKRQTYAGAVQSHLPHKPDKWQSNDNAFNEVSRVIHSHASGAVRDIRTSMSTRISLNYARVLLETFVIAAIVIALVIAIGIVPRLNNLYENAVRQVTSAAYGIAGGLNAIPTPEPTAHPSLYTTAAPPRDNDAVQNDTRYNISLIDISLYTQDEAYAFVGGMDGRVYFDNAPFDMSRGHALRYWNSKFYYVRSRFVNVNGYTYQLCVGIALTYWIRLTLIVIAGLFAIDIMRGAYFVLRGHKLNSQLIEPIEKISETARHLNAMNLSERIDVENTHFELRELALVINEMLDRLQAAYEGQKQFVSDASHELRTPIAVIQGYASMLERWGKDNPAVRDEAIAAINKEVVNIKELIEKLLFLARHDQQTLTTKSEKVDLHALVEETIAETRIIASDREIITGKIEDIYVLGDSSALKQALRIFIDNACKYTSPGGKITVSCIRGGIVALLSVNDNGRGIPAQHLKRIFDRFYRVDDSRGAVPGHGLGLSIARIIAVNHGGRINVRSREGIGSTFTLELPGIIN